MKRRTATEHANPADRKIGGVLVDVLAQVRAAGGDLGLDVVQPADPATRPS